MFRFIRKISNEKINTDVNLGCPSIIFNSTNIAADMKMLDNNGVKVNDLMDLAYGFYDQDGNQFLIHEG